jgi:GntR family transcriptional regulator, transcriptional repressor for pyruvate dehydrogenase complex
VYLRRMGERGPALEAVFKPMQRLTTLDETVQRLGRAIRLGVLAPGSQLPSERELAAQLCINRSTLHEALTTLVQDGYVVALRGRGGGTFVAEAPPLSSGNKAVQLRDELRGLLDQRVAIETGATILAGERAASADLDLLDAAIERMGSATTFDDYRRADVRFHIGIAEAARSPRLVALMTEVQGHLNDVIVGMDHSVKRLTGANSQHRRLVALLRMGDPAPAVLAMHEHIEQSERVLEG